MNKKLFAMMMVPVVVVMGGTFAFSAWQGSANAYFGQTAATVAYTESLNFFHTNASANPLTISTGPGNSALVTSATQAYQVSSESGGATSNLKVYVNITGFVPGDWIQFNVNISNQGSATLNTSEVGFSTAVVNGNGQIVTPGNYAPIGFLQPPVSQAYLDHAVNTGYFGSIYHPDLTWLVNATASGSTNTHISNGQYIEYSFFGILSKQASASAAGSTIQLTISIPLSVDQ